MPNLANAKMVKKSDKIAILHRVLWALLDDQDCYYPSVAQWRELTHDQTMNWRARRTILRLVAKLKK